MDAGMDDYVSKPLDPRKVFQAIERWADCGPAAAEASVAEAAVGEVAVAEAAVGEAPVAEASVAEAPAAEESGAQASAAANSGEETGLQETGELEANENVPLDVESALNRFSEDRIFYYNLLGDFLHSLPSRLAEMKMALASGDTQSLSYLAHNLKGVSANFSALQLARLSTDMDTVCREGDLEAAKNLFVEVEAAAERLEQQAAALMAAGTEQVG
jgi:HPt (histidine-containing phosphotransfer) domain-containing protein